MPLECPKYGVCQECDMGKTSVHCVEYAGEMNMPCRMTDAKIRLLGELFPDSGVVFYDNTLFFL